MTSEILEVEPWDVIAAGGPEQFAATVTDSNTKGVLVKVSQGQSWRADYAAELFAALPAKMFGAKHTADAVTADAVTELAAIEAALPQGVSLPLGVVIELADLGGHQPYELAGYVEQLLNGVGNAAERAGLLCGLADLQAMPGAPWAARWWALNLTATSDVPPPSQFAYFGGSGRWSLTTFRGIVPPSSPAPTAPAAPAETPPPPPAGSTEPPATGTAEAPQGTPDATEPPVDTVGPPPADPNAPATEPPPASS